MSDESLLVDGGYQAVVRALDRDECELNVDVLAMACARKARMPSLTRDESLGWARAAIDCYRKAAERRRPGYDRQGSEVPLYGLKGLMILRWGTEPGNTVLDLEDFLRWIQEELDQHADPAAFGDALARTDAGSQHERAVCLRERLEVGLPLFEKGLLPPDLLAWFEQAELLRNQ